MVSSQGRIIAALILSNSIFPGATRAAEGTDDAGKTGAFSLSATPAEAVGADSSAAFASIVPPAEGIDWQVVVPESYDPAKPPGLLVYISPTDSGTLPPQWQGLPESHNLIWVAADESGNQIDVARRITYSLFAVGLVSRRYEIDGRRIYLSGFSGGARVAGLVAAAYPQVFKGEIYIGGAEIWDSEPTPSKLQAMQKNRYVFIVGSDDSNRRTAGNVARKYAAAGIVNLQTMIISRRGHELPVRRDMSDALKYLDDVQ